MLNFYHSAYSITAKGAPVASLTGIPSWLDLLTDCEAAIV